MYKSSYYWMDTMYMQALDNAQKESQKMTLLLSALMDTISRAKLIASISVENMSASIGKDAVLTTVPQTATALTPAFIQ